MSVPVYISEAAPPDLRGKGSSIVQFSYFSSKQTQSYKNIINTWLITVLIVFKHF